ncbi:MULTISPECIES: L-threonylcarbamoyladenylate synthase [unclassified Oceanobacter]|uniref:L-threonylcarbamoyladenylate synthase n=1 Tax=unclassified Oceanobacter TaxID=2620260 RepID=UPI0026E2426B|nr:MULTISPECIES: Sua5/YciO/YrdC/YwlC family protein [unclassified Oceanobacter]MDO6680868.1 Sua5/YciO/YrdC/YwlC family protein [Oceanobacter sp. 5_MG-2023]MDP2504635.1 Sua5/YciO/YrdC/YwlC family protein [Oceanobacter sp. 3_MG-2023]MDP2546910.1 Sua5/YciO/YrdC/YwlC family protein [Oceanobacter sp. 4_MG-2023]MDP2607734.1 Sua5/YciO/YrdC/YwlC family protein [Oceanobacter sp. 1_MG-2023]MDP2611082.1 Sua5/YciO/YrdC/YwlC family protein [Oceanobacter sp. 2_MG-2023]
MSFYLNAWHLQQACRAVNSGGVIAYPTEAVWGLGCHPADERAIERILALKQRPWQKGLVVVAASLSQLDDWLLPLSSSDEAQVRASWPGPVSWVLPCRDDVSPLLRGEHASLAVRIADHPLVSALCQQVGPLVSTSANPAGAEPARTALKVRQYFADDLDYLLPGVLGGRRQPSEIRTLDGTRLR